jgi:FixJ family two-component response regulator
MIAVVDDADSVRKAVVRLLQAAGYAARGFASGHEFLQAWPSNPARCIIMDVEMPGLSGTDVQRALNRANVGIPVVILTAHDAPTVREECMRLGALFFLSKPIDVTHLLNAVAAVFARKRVEIPMECDTQ